MRLRLGTARTTGSAKTPGTIAAVCGLALLTPTQTALLLLREDPDAPLLESQLGDLAYEQPLNLDKVAQWARTTGHAGHFARVRQHVERRQREGVRLRRRGRFVSALPT